MSYRKSKAVCDLFAGGQLFNAAVERYEVDIRIDSTKPKGYGISISCESVTRNFGPPLLHRYLFVVVVDHEHYWLGILSWRLVLQWRRSDMGIGCKSISIRSTPCFPNR